MTRLRDSSRTHENLGSSGVCTVACYVIERVTTATTNNNKNQAGYPLSLCLHSMNREETAAVIVQDGILINREHLERSELVGRVIQETREGKQHVVVGSPPATGKTSLLQLIEKEYRNAYNATRVIKLTINESMKPQFLFDHLDGKGISQDADKLAQLGDTLLLIDDAQNAYSTEFNGLWQFVVKHVGSAEKRGKLFVVIATTYYMEVPGSPVAFRTLPHFPSAGETLALSNEEADRLFNMHAVQRGYESWINYRDALKEPSNFHVGVIIQGLALLETVHKGIRRRTFTEDEALNMLRGDNLLDN